MRVSKTAMILVAAFPFLGISGLADEKINLINFTPSPSQNQVDERISTIVHIEQKVERFSGDQGFYSLVVEGPPAKKVFNLLKKFDGPTVRYGATDVDTKREKNVVCIYAFQRYGYKTEAEKNTYRCWFKFGDEAGLVSQ
mgnify:CR=1 FL=1|jgi:hypothetical protein